MEEGKSAETESEAQSAHLRLTLDTDASASVDDEDRTENHAPERATGQRGLLSRLRSLKKDGADLLNIAKDGAGKAMLLPVAPLVVLHPEIIFETDQYRRVRTVLEFKPSLDWLESYVPLNLDAEDEALEREKTVWGSLILLRYEGEVVERRDSLITKLPASLEVAVQREDRWTDNLPYLLADGEGQLTLTKAAGPKEKDPESQTVYKGTWSLGLRQGLGEGLVGGGLVIHVGSWKDGKRHGDDGHTEYYSGEFRDKVVYTYTGAYEEGQRSGKGLIVTADNCKYEGEFLKGKKHGEGMEVFSNGAIYRGSFMDNKAHGAGECVFPDGSKYSGAWEHGKRSGDGTLVYSTMHSYVGEWSEDKRTGQGKFLSPSGATVYEGGFLRNKYHGVGKLVESPGHVYEGEFQHGKRSGLGVDRVNETVYTGRFVNDQRCGFGELIEDGLTSHGNWKDNQLHGKAKVTFPDGMGFLSGGEFVLGQPQGLHYFTDSHGRSWQHAFQLLDCRNTDSMALKRVNKLSCADSIITFKGLATEDLLPHGPGEAVYSSGWKYSGEFRFGLPDGRGTKIHTVQGLKFVGKFSRGMRKGLGTLTSPGSTFTGRFKQDQQEGFGVVEFHASFFATMARPLSETKTQSAQNMKNLTSGRRNRSVASSLDSFGSQDSLYEALSEITQDLPTNRPLRYEGECSEGMPSGTGTLKLLNGDRIDGTWKALVPCEQKVTITYPNGSNYRGCLDAEVWLSHGQGVLETADGHRYSGVFDRGELKEGTIRFPNGNKYCGGLSEFKPSGPGSLDAVGGSRTSGHWFQGTRTGVGFLRWPDGMILAQHMENGCVASEREVSLEVAMKMGFEPDL